jgi:hypothetical protein
MSRSPTRPFELAPRGLQFITSHRYSGSGTTTSPGRKTTIPAAGSAIQGNDLNQRPLLMDRDTISRILRQGATGPPAITTHHQPPSRLSLEDLLGQGRHESEAETNILAAFEAQQYNRRKDKKSHRHSTSNASSIFSGVSGSLWNEIVNENDDFNDNNNNNKKVDPHVRDSTSKSVESNNENNNTSGPSNSNINEENQALLNETADNAPVTTHETSHRKDRFNRLARTSYAHRRVMSVEDQLAGLKLAMLDFQDGVHHQRDADDTFHATNDAEDSSGYIGDGDDALGTNTSASEMLGHSVGLLLDPVTPGGDGQRSTTADAGYLPTLREESHHKGGDESGSSIMDSSDRPDVVAGDIENAMDNRPGNETTANAHESVTDNQPKRRRRLFFSAAVKVKDDLEAWQTFFSPRNDTFWAYVKLMLFYVTCPLTGTASILFYLAGNPPTGKSEDGDPGPNPSASWWLLFVVRQVVTFSIGLGLQSLFIDILCVGTRFMVHILGPVLTLLIVQSKGWPFVLVRYNNIS